MILFNTLACSPVSLLTPAASVIIIKAIVIAKANKGESQPSFIPMVVATHIERAEWVLGIPPAPINLLISHFFSVK